MGDFDEEKRYDEEVDPIVRQLMEKCREIGLPCMVFINFSQTGEDLGVIKGIPGSPLISERAPNIFRATWEVYNAISEGQMEVSGIQFLSKEDLNKRGWTGMEPPTKAPGGPYLN